MFNLFHNTTAFTFKHSLIDPFSLRPPALKAPSSPHNATEEAIVK